MVTYYRVFGVTSIAESLRERLKLVEERAEAARVRVEEMETGHAKLQEVERAAATSKREAEAESQLLRQRAQELQVPHAHTNTRACARAHTHIHTRARTRIHTYMVYVGGETNAARAGLGASGVSATPSNPLLRPSHPLSLCLSVPRVSCSFPPPTPLLNTCCMLSYAHAAGAHHGDGSRQERIAGRGGTVPAVR